jgi:hypothetical protein
MTTLLTLNFQTYEDEPVLARIAHLASGKAASAAVESRPP